MQLSIITINYNNAEGFRRTAESVVAQSYEDFEWIVIDGGSNDGSKELINEYSNKISYWVSEPDNGVYHAMNKGIAQAKGEWLQFLNSGDSFHSNDVLISIPFADYHDSDVLYADSYILEPVRNKWVKKEPDIMTLNYLRGASVGHQSSFIKKTCFDEVGLYNEDYKIVSDWEFFLKAFLQNKKFSHLPTVVADYDMTGISNSCPELSNKEGKQVEEKYLPKYIKADMELLDHYRAMEYLMTHRRSTRPITIVAVRIATFLENFFSKIEQRRYKRLEEGKKTH